MIKKKINDVCLDLFVYWFCQLPILAKYVYGVAAWSHYLAYGPSVQEYRVCSQNRLLIEHNITSFDYQHQHHHHHRLVIIKSFCMHVFTLTQFTHSRFGSALRGLNFVLQFDWICKKSALQKLILLMIILIIYLLCWAQYSIKNID